MTPKISVIVPVYKVETYLPACLESITAQIFRDFELILVDDGSPDTCGAMCDAYAADHSNTRVLHQANAGLSEARNNAVKIARGEYVTFIDSDDFVTPDYLEYLLYLAEKNNADVSCGQALSFPDGIVPTLPVVQESEQYLSAEQALSGICYGKFPIFACSKLYKRELAAKYPYPAGQLYEDTATTYKLVGAAGHMAYGNRVIYYWRQRSGSITHSAINERHFYGITAAKEQLAYMEQHYPSAVPAARARCAMKIIDLSYRLVMGKMDRSLFERIRAEIKPLLPQLKADHKAGRSLKIRSTALCWGYLPYRILSLIYYELCRLTKHKSFIPTN